MLSKVLCASALLVSYANAVMLKPTNLHGMTWSKIRPLAAAAGVDSQDYARAIGPAKDAGISVEEYLKRPQETEGEQVQETVKLQPETAWRPPA
jgi:hypothetical protein